MDIAIIGFGNRGQAYADIIKDIEDIKLAAVCDFNPLQIERAKSVYGVKNCFSDEGQFLKEKRGDVLIVATMDRDHYRQVMRALELGYHILLEKPISVSEKECIEIERAAKKYGRRIAVCHVLRYTAFYGRIKQILDSGELGKAITMTQTENVGYWHQAHSFVRGNWRNTEQTAPMILAKCCHDLDIIAWLAGERCETVSSFGGLSFFTARSAPEGSAANCIDCKLRKDCIYDAVKFYSENEGFLKLAAAHYKGNEKNPSAETVLSDRSNPYSRCVFACDNNAVDHQIVNMLFENGFTAQLTMTAFSAEFKRTLKIHCTGGEIEGDFARSSLNITVFGKSGRTEDTSKLARDLSGHGGGDKAMTEDFLASLTGKKTGAGLTDISHSIMSHRMAFAAEDSRLHNGRAIKLEE